MEKAVDVFVFIYYWSLLQISYNVSESKPLDINVRQKRNVIKGYQEESYTWSNATVNYLVALGDDSQMFDPNGASYKLLKESMEDIQKVSCIKFVEHTTLTSIPEDLGYLFIYKGDKCAATTGYSRAINRLILKEVDSSQTNGKQVHCISKRIITHELFHVLGFLHEHQRVDRDKYINIHEENILEDHLKHFEIQEQTMYKYSDALGTKYDRLSIMQYKSDEFSKNKKATITWKEDEKLHTGGDQMSPMDILRLNTYYNCPGFTKLPQTLKVKTRQRKSKKLDEVKEPKYHCPANICLTTTGIVQNVVKDGFRTGCYMGVSFGCEKIEIKDSTGGY